MAHVHTLAEGNVEVLRALENISQRVGNLFGDQGLSNDATRRNGKGELVNEDGLPIVEITEPVDELDTPSLTAATDEIVEDHYPEHFRKLSPEALIRRDQILQMLEEEEEREKWRTKDEHQARLQRKRELARTEMEKRMLNQGFELEKRRRTKEVEVRMAKALVGNAGEKARSVALGGQRKKVTFEEPCEEPHSKPIQSSSRSASFPAKEPMKKDVIERTFVPTPLKDELPKLLVDRRSLDGIPRTGRSSKAMVLSRTLTFMNNSPDSDDESEPDNDISVGSLNGDVALSAKMHCDLALEYHKRRETLMCHSVDLSAPVDPSNWNQENVSLDASLSRQPPRPSVSKFKESRLKQGISKSFPGSGKTFETTMPPRTWRDSVRMGKLIHGQLVGYDDEEEIK